MAYAEQVVAFGYLHNTTKDQDYDYLETIFPNSFAASIHAIYNIDVKKPLQIEKELNLHSQSLKRVYKIFELRDLAEKISADLFVYGSFALLPENRIEITLNTYINGNDEIFSFTNIGKMETEISRLVDRITIIVINLMNEDSFFRSNKIHNFPVAFTLPNFFERGINNITNVVFFISFIKQHSARCN